MSKNDQQHALVPRLRFPEFRDAQEWETRSGDRLFESTNNRASTSGLPVLAITQEQGAVPRDEIDYHVSVSSKSIENYKEVCPGDFIISLRSFQGGIEYSSYHGICSPAYVVLRQKFDGESGFFRHYFKSERFIRQLTRNLEGLRDGKMISYKQFSEQDLLFPDSREQQKIADCLGSLDDLIAAEGRKLAALRDHKKGLMQQLFPREGETRPRLRFPEFRDAGEWQVKKAGTLFSQRKERGEAGLPIYSVTINDGMVLRSTFDRNFYDIEDPAGNKKACKKDIAYNMMRMWQGACGVAVEDCMVSPAYVVLKPKKGTCPAFFDVLFKRPATLHLLTAYSRGLTLDRLRLYFDDFASIPLLIPSEKEQQRIAGCLSALDSLIAAQAEKLDALRTHKRGLMQKIFPSPKETTGGASNAAV